MKIITNFASEAMLCDQLITTLDEYRRLGLSAQVDYEKFYLYSLITHSTAIEGSSMTEVETQLLFDEGISSPGRTLQEQMMNLDLKQAYEAAMAQAQGHTDFTVEMLCKLSALVMRRTGTVYNTLQGKFDSSCGELRLVNVTAGGGGRSYMNFRKVPDRLAAFCTWLNDRRHALLAASTDVVGQYLLSFDAHYELVTIHPWVDGNGRMARLAMNYLQVEFGLVPAIVDKADKAGYIQALIDSRDQGSTEPFRQFMLAEHIHNLRREIASHLRDQG